MSGCWKLYFFSFLYSWIAVNNIFSFLYSWIAVLNNIFSFLYSWIAVLNNIFSFLYCWIAVLNNIFSFLYSWIAVLNNIFRCLYSSMDVGNYIFQWIFHVLFFLPCSWCVSWIRQPAFRVLYSYAGTPSFYNYNYWWLVHPLLCFLAGEFIDSHSLIIELSKKTILTTIHKNISESSLE